MAQKKSFSLFHISEPEIFCFYLSKEVESKNKTKRVRTLTEVQNTVNTFAELQLRPKAGALWANVTSQ